MSSEEPNSGGRFLPEPSFQSWRAYRIALASTGSRFRKRALARARLEDELGEVVARSKNPLRRTLNWWDLLWMSVGAVVGAGIFVTTGTEARDVVGPAIVLSYVVAGISSMLSVFCYTEFAIEVPVAGGSFAYLRIELGDFIAYIAAGNIILEFVIGQGAVARGWTSNFAALINRHPDSVRIHVSSLPHGYNRLDPIAAAVTLIFGILAVVSTRLTATANWIASVANMVLITFIIIAGFAKGDSSNLTPFVPFGTGGIFTAATVVYFAYLGFDAVATLAEETKKPARDVPIGLLAAMTLITAVYCLMALALCSLQSYTSIDRDAPFAFAFSAIGWHWAQYVVALAALKGMTTVLLVSSVSEARYLTHIARTHMISPWFAAVSSRTSTPVRATVTLLIIAAIVGFFTSLDTLASLLSISTLGIFTLVALALLIRRHYSVGETPANRLYLLLCLVAITAIAAGIATGAYQREGGGGAWPWYLGAGVVWLVATAAIKLLIPQTRKPTTWGVPLVPWLPSASIAINIFLLGAIDKASYIRFAVMTGIILVYYVFIGLHASYDAAVELEEHKAGARKAAPATQV